VFVFCCVILCCAFSPAPGVHASRRTTLLAFVVGWHRKTGHNAPRCLAFLQPAVRHFGCIIIHDSEHGWNCSDSVYTHVCECLMCMRMSVFLCFPFPTWSQRYAMFPFVWWNYYMATNYKQDPTTRAHTPSPTQTNTHIHKHTWRSTSIVFTRGTDTIGNIQITLSFHVTKTFITHRRTLFTTSPCLLMCMCDLHAEQIWLPHQKMPQLHMTWWSIDKSTMR
jgi:hypothetical protein